MSVFDLLVMVIVGLWIYSQLLKAESMRQVKEHLNTIELRYSSGKDHNDE